MHAQTLSRKSLSVVITAFTGAFVAGTIVLFGGGANAASTDACTVSKPAVVADASTGMTDISWTASGTCGGVSIDMVMVDVDGSEKVIQSDSIADDLAGSFRYGTLVSGTSYDFRVHGETDSTSAPVSLYTVEG